MKVVKINFFVKIKYFSLISDLEIYLQNLKIHTVVQSIRIIKPYHSTYNMWMCLFRNNQIINPHFSYFIDIKISISSSGIILQNAIQCSFSDAFHIDKTISDLTWGISLRVYVINVLKNRVHDFFLIYKVFCFT